METNFNATLALPAACVRVPAYLAASAAVHAEQPVGTTLIQVQPSRTRVQGTNGLAIKVSAKGMDPVGGVRGIPPRGWPV
jgi:hypothetical protein